VIRSGLDVWLHGIYYPSRIPGYTLDEILMGGLAWLGGSTACATAATVASLITLAYLRGLAPLYGIPNSFRLVLAFSFEPWIWSSGTHALDYIWTTGALVAALYHVERRQFAAAGLACAIGYGFRPTSLLWIVPVFIRVLAVERRWRRVLRFALWAAIPALVPSALMMWIRITRPDAWAGLGPVSGQTLVMVGHAYPTLLSLAAYHLIELSGIPAFLILLAGCYKYWRPLLDLLRRREGWVWICLLIFVLQLPTFIMDSEKTEYMLPALPGLFLIFGRCLTDIWWNALTAGFIFSAFVAFGFGHVSQLGGVRIAFAVPTLRPGALLWYTGRARHSNDIVTRTGEELAQRGRIIRTPEDFDRLDEFYVSSLLHRGPAAQARIACPLIPTRLSFPSGGTLEIAPTNGLPRSRPSDYPMLVCCRSTSALVLLHTPALQKGSPDAIIPEFCERG
jgi:hypothetical protein